MSDIKMPKEVSTQKGIQHIRNKYKRIAKNEILKPRREEKAEWNRFVKAFHNRWNTEFYRKHDWKPTPKGKVEQKEKANASIS